MVRILLVVLSFFMAHAGFGQQEEKILFSEALSMHLPKYEKEAKNAYFYRDFERGEMLFDSLVDHGLNGSYMDNFNFHRLNKKTIGLHELEKPVYFITYASWCVTTKGEIPALNELAEKYSDEVDFVILFWDDRKTTKQAAKDYNENIRIFYIDELENKDAFVVSRLKHSLGLPTIFLLDETKKIVDIRRGVTHSYHKSMEESLDANYTRIYDGIASLLLKEDPDSSRTGPVAASN